MPMITFISRCQVPLQRMTAAQFRYRIELDETLVPDVRGNPSPAQMVDDKVQALLASCGRSLQPQRRKS